MTTIGVDPAELRALADVIRGAADEVDAATSDRRGLAAPSAALVEPRLVAALDAFVRRWGDSLRQLSGDAHRLADALDLAAALYDDAELATAAAFPGAAAVVREAAG